MITHGGVGSILTGLRHNKKIIVAPRLAKHKEHVNDHQLQIINRFYEEGYILPLKDFDKLDNCKSIGISAGASAPEYLVDELIDFLQQRYDNINIRDVIVAEENTSFR